MTTNSKHNPDSPLSNPLRSIYEFELRRLAYWTSRHTAELFALTEPGPYLAKVDIAIDPLIYAIISDAARIQKLIVAGKRQKNESAKRFAFRDARASYLSSLLQGLELNEVRRTAVRNSLEHFDEWLDDIAIKIAGLTDSMNAFVTTSLCAWELPPVLASPVGIPLHAFDLQESKPVLPVRIYIASQRTYYNMGTSLDFDALQREATAIVKRTTPPGTELETVQALLVYV